MFRSFGFASLFHQRNEMVYLSPEGWRKGSPSTMAGTRKTSSQDKVYVIQRHEATRLHWDLRLEMDGVLKSWTLPKKPPLGYGVKRLAVQVEDHTIGYADFHGVIPEGRYGAGRVEIWDRGTYRLLARTENKIEVLIQGEKLYGPYVLIRTKWREARKHWLFFKMKKPLPHTSKKPGR